jgi:hypothetical protein
MYDAGTSNDYDRRLDARTTREVDSLPVVMVTRNRRLNAVKLRNKGVGNDFVNGLIRFREGAKRLVVRELFHSNNRATKSRQMDVDH